MVSIANLGERVVGYYNRLTTGRRISGSDFSQERRDFLKWSAATVAGLGAVLLNGDDGRGPSEDVGPDDGSPIFGPGSVEAAEKIPTYFQKNYTIVMDPETSIDTIWGVVEQTLFGRVLSDKQRQKFFKIKRGERFTKEGAYVVTNKDKITSYQDVGVVYGEKTAKTYRHYKKIDDQDFDWIFAQKSAKNSDTITIDMRAVYEFLKAKGGKKRYTTIQQFEERLKQGAKALDPDDDRKGVVVDYDQTVEERYAKRLAKVKLPGEDGKSKKWKLARLIKETMYTGKFAGVPVVDSEKPPHVARVRPLELPVPEKKALEFAGRYFDGRQLYMPKSTILLR